MKYSVKLNISTAFAIQRIKPSLFRDGLIYKINSEDYFPTNVSVA